MIMSLRQAIVILALTMTVFGSRIRPRLLHWVAGCGTFNAIQILNRDPTPEEEKLGCLYVEKDISASIPESPKGSCD